jgi:hypothetical protein
MKVLSRSLVLGLRQGAQLDRTTSECILGVLAHSGGVQGRLVPFYSVEYSIKIV